MTVRHTVAARVPDSRRVGPFVSFETARRSRCSLMLRDRTQSTQVLAVCFPPSDLGFGERVRQIVGGRRWDLGPSEGIEMMQAHLRTNYPMAIVRARQAMLAGGWHATVVLDVHRDGPAESEGHRVRLTPPKERDR